MCEIIAIFFLRGFSLILIMCEVLAGILSSEVEYKTLKTSYSYCGEAHILVNRGIPNFKNVINNGNITSNNAILIHCK